MSRGRTTCLEDVQIGDLVMLTKVTMSLAIDDVGLSRLVIFLGRTDVFKLRSTGESGANFHFLSECGLLSFWSLNCHRIDLVNRC